LKIFADAVRQHLKEKYTHCRIYSNADRIDENTISFSVVGKFRKRFFVIGNKTKLNFSDPDLLSKIDEMLRDVR